MDSVDLRQHPAVPTVLALAALGAGVALGLGGPALAGWLADLIGRSPLPTPGLVHIAADLPPAWAIPIGTLLGIVAAALLAGAATRESLKLTITPDHIEHRQEDREGWIERSQAGPVYREGRHLVVLDEAGGLLARLDADALSDAAVREAFTSRGYQWHEQDPFESDFERWMSGRPGFTEAEHALIRRWQQTRRTAPERAEAEAALREAGLVARTSGDHTQVRRVRAAEPGSRATDS